MNGESDKAEWYYAPQGGGQVGPVTFAQLREAVQRRQLTGADLVWREGMADWQPAARQVPALFDAGSGSYDVQPTAAPAPAPIPAQPIGYAQPYQPRYGRYAYDSVPNYLVQSILVTIFCCWPFGIPSIVYAAQVNSKLAVGDYQGAVDSSNKAKFWAWTSFWVTVGGGLLYFLIIMIAVAAGA